MDNEQFTMLLNYFSFSWAGYQKVKKGVKKRILRHMDEMGCRNIEAYIHRLETDQAAKLECERLLAVSISRFFRDPDLWKLLQERIFPCFFSTHTISVWSAGCAGGEEVYSLKIIWHELLKKQSGLPSLHLTATDLNPDNIERAKKGVYQASSFKAMDLSIRDQYFEKGPTRKLWRVKPFLKEDITWDTMNLFHHRPAGKKYDIIFLRNNILLYAGEEVKTAGFENVVSNLRDDGFLVIGAKDTLPKGISGFQCADLPYVFRKAFSCQK